MIGLAVLSGSWAAELRAQFTPFAYTYGGTGSEAGYSVAEAPDGGYVCAGQTGSFSFGSGDMYFFKTTVNGQLVWQTHYGGAGIEGARAVTRGHGGGFLVAGYTNSFGNGGYDYYLVRTDEQGDTVWTRTYGGTDWDFAYSVCQTSDGGYLVAGETYSFGAGGSDVWVLKLDDNGDTTRTFLWGNTGNQTCRAVKEYQPGRAAVAGHGNFPLSDGQDAFLLGIDHAAGTYLFQTIVPYAGDQQLTALDRSTSGGFVTFGIHIEPGHSKDLFVQFYQLNGSSQLNVEIAGGNEQYDLELHGGINFDNQGYYVAGSSRALGGNDYEALFFRLSTDPYVTLGRVITAPRYNALHSILRSADRGIVMAGTAEGFGPGPSGAFIWKLDSLCQTGPYPVPMLSVDKVETAGFGIYPNPFAGELQLSVPESAQLSHLLIYDMNGRLVHRENLNGISGHATLYLGNLQNGMYAAELVAGSGKRYYTKLVKTP